jgi:omega-amidase
VTNNPGDMKMQNRIMPEKLKITLVQSNLIWEDVAANIAMFSQKLDSLNVPTDLIILPEMFSTGFSMNVEKLAEPVAESKALAWMKKTAEDKNCCITGSLMLKENGKYYNRLIWMNPDGSFKHYDKRHLFSLSNEQQVYTPGREKIMVELKDWKICPLICFDLRFPVWSRNQKSEPYDLLIYVANWPERRIYAWKHLLIARAIENQAYVIGLNRIGNDGNNIYHSGDSMVVDAMGGLVYHKTEVEDITTFELDFAHLQKIRETLPFLKDADAFAIEPKAKIKSH